MENTTQTGQSEQEYSGEASGDIWGGLFGNVFGNHIDGGPSGENSGDSSGEYYPDYSGDYYSDYYDLDENQLKFYQDGYKFLRGFYKYGWPIIYGLGIPGNILTLIVLFSRAYKWGASNISVVTLAIADIVMLIGTMFNHLSYLSVVSISGQSTAGCLATTYIFSVAKPLSSLILAFIMIERAIAISFPLRSLHWLTQKRMFICNLCIIGFLLVYYLPVFYAYGLISDSEYPDSPLQCRYPAKHEYWGDFYFVGWGLAVLCHIIPMLVIITCSTIIIVKLCSVKATLLQKSSKNSVRDTTIMLLSVGIFFFITTTVQTVDEIGFNLGMYSSETQSGQMNATFVSQVGWNLALLNNAVNFLLYCATGRRFRTAFRAIFCPCCTQKKASTRSSQTYSTKLSSYESTIAKEDSHI